MYISPGMFLDATLVDSDLTSSNYNLPLITEYIKSNILSVLLITDVPVGYGLSPFGSQPFGS